jgi:hypothetical protein
LVALAGAIRDNTLCRCISFTALRESSMTV